MFRIQACAFYLFYFLFHCIHLATFQVPLIKMTGVFSPDLFQLLIWDLPLQVDERRAPLRTWENACGPTGRKQPAEVDEYRTVPIKVDPECRWVRIVSRSLLLHLTSAFLLTYSAYFILLKNEVWFACSSLQERRLSTQTSESIIMGFHEDSGMCPADIIVSKLFKYPSTPHNFY